MLDMRVWVGCLGCYNGGRLIGEWFDAEDAPTDEPEWQAAVRARSAADSTTELRWLRDHVLESHEELWCLDTEGLEPFITGECSPVAAKELAEQLDGLDDHELETLRVYLEGVGIQSLGRIDDWADVAADAVDKFVGRASSLADWAEEFAEETGALTPRDDFGRSVKHGIPDEILRNIDWKGVAQEWTEGMTVVEHDGEVWLFSA